MDENKNIYIARWLLLITFLVVLMIFVGGLTRLTDSGLSITKWYLFSGILPPLNTHEWENAFALYQEIPQFKLLNYSMNLEEFKAIYWWEYIHRLLGRLIGLFYFIPLVFFTFKRYFAFKSIISLYSIFILICIQGFIGWYMVQSGLSEKTDVSHYRLSIHLTIAFVILILLVWNFFSFKEKNNFGKKNKLPIFLPIVFTFLILLQISVGALVSGLDAGQIYQTWPLMGESYFPNDSTFNDFFILKSLETPSLVQFLHRNIAYLIIVFFLILSTIVFIDNGLFYLRKTILLIFFLLVLQIFLGILTILSGAQILLASMHQIGSIFLLISTVVLIFKNSKN